MNQQQHPFSNQGVNSNTGEHYYYHPGMIIPQQNPPLPTDDNQLQAESQPLCQPMVPPKPVEVSQSGVSAPAGWFPQPASYMPFADPMVWQKQQEQKAFSKKITRDAQWIGAGLLFVQVIGTIAIFLIPALVDLIFPGASTGGSVYYDAIEYAFYSPLAIMLSFWITAKASRRSLVDLMPFEKHSFGLSLGCVLFSFAGVAIGNFIAGIVGTAFPQIEENLEAASGALASNPAELVVEILYMAAIPALVEEFAFRGVVLGMLRPYGDRFAIVASALLFALLHGNFIQIPFAFFVGIMLAYATVRTNSMIPAIIIHFINNAMSSLMTYFDQSLTQLLGDWYGLYVYGTWVLLGLAGFLVLRVGYRQKLSACYQPFEGCISCGRRTGSFYKAGALIAAMVVYLLTAFILALPVSL